MNAEEKAEKLEALLREALDFFNDRPNFGLRRDPHSTSYKLAAKIDKALREL